MPILFKNFFSKSGKILCLTMLFSSTISNVVAHEKDYNNFPTGQQEGGGVRGQVVSCTSDVSYPVPLVPQDTQTLTTLASPKLFFDASNVERTIALDFLLLDRDDEIVYQNVLKSDRQSGLISLDLVDRYNSNELKTNHSYHWYLVQKCGDRSNPKIVANGSLRRIELDKKLAVKINKASAIDRIGIYQEANVWHEKLEYIAQLKCSDSNTNLLDRQLARVSNLTDISPKLSTKSLSNYCATNLQAESMVMK